MSVHTALVLAGSRAGGDPLAAYAGVSHKALISVGNQPMLERVVAALAVVPGIERILIAIEQPDIAQRCNLDGVLPDGTHIEYVPTCQGPSATAAAAFERYGAPLLVTTADHALLRPEWVSDFLRRVPATCDAAVLLAPRTVVTAAVPQTRRTYLRFADGEWSGCNLFLLQTPRAAGVVRFWQGVEAERKHPARLLRHLGIGFALRYRLGWLRLDAALARVRALSGATVAVVESPYGLAAVDVDKPDDLDLVRQLVAAGRD